MTIKLTAEDKNVARMMGISEEAFARTKLAAIAAGTIAADPAPKKPGKGKPGDEEEDPEASGEGEPVEEEEEELDLDDADAVKKHLEAQQQKIADLEAENAELREQLDGADQEAEDEEAAAEGDEEEDPKGKKKPGKPAPKPKGPSAEVAKLRAELTKRDVIAAVDAASRAGKLPPAKRASAIALGMKIGVEGLKTTFEMLPKAINVRPHSAPDTKAAGAVRALTKEDLDVCKQMNITPEAFAASKAHAIAHGSIAAR